MIDLGGLEAKGDYSSDIGISSPFSACSMDLLSLFIVSLFSRISIVSFNDKSSSYSFFEIVIDSWFIVIGSIRYI